MFRTILKARCCVKGDKQVALQEFDPNNIYAVVVRNETIRIFIAKLAAQYMIVERTDIYEMLICTEI